MSTHANTNNKERPNFFKAVGKFLKGVRSELRKVNWPNRTELFNHTSVVVVSCTIATLLLWVLDLTFGFGLNIFLK